MPRRVKTYIAADWDNDISAVNQLREWNDNKWLPGIDFVDVHEFTQSRDSSLCCTIKRSLNERMIECKTFILIVGGSTNTLTKGSCQYCDNYRNNSGIAHCASGNSVHYQSYIEYECCLAAKSNLAIVVLYNSSHVNKQLCPEAVRNKGVHIPMKVGEVYNYFKVSEAIRKAELFYYYSQDGMSNFC